MRSFARRRTIVTSNYEIKTTSAIEYAFVATPDSPPKGGWPVEEKLRRAQQGLRERLRQCCLTREESERQADLDLLIKSGAKMREPMPLAVLDELMLKKNVQLAEIEEPPLMLAEAMGARLYTGPLFVKYNAVLRGLGSEVLCVALLSAPDRSRCYRDAPVTQPPHTPRSRAGSFPQECDDRALLPEARLPRVHGQRKERGGGQGHAEV